MRKVHRYCNMYIASAFGGVEKANLLAGSRRELIWCGLCRSTDAAGVWRILEASVPA